MLSLYRSGAAVFCLFLVMSCTRHAEAPVLENPGVDAELGNPQAVLSLANGPLWFELSADGLNSITHVKDASLSPFEAWPLVKRIAGFCLYKGRVVAAVNREGFLAFAQGKDGRLFLYRMPDAADWGNYSVSSLFLYRDRPAVLLYRDNFFIDSTAPALTQRIKSLPNAGQGAVDAQPSSSDDPSAVPVVPEPAAFSAYPAADGWDIQGLERTKDGSWLFKAVRDEKTGGDLRYCLCRDLDSAGEVSTAAAFQQSQLPRAAADAASPLRELIEAVSATLSDDKVVVVTAISENLPLAESYLVEKDENRSVSSSLESDRTDVGRAWASVDGSSAYCLLPDGQLFVKTAGQSELGRAQLPPLDQGFVYTGMAAIGQNLIASWEEQDGWAVGSAGFVVFKAR